jgi:hypothetical protein
VEGSFGLKKKIYVTYDPVSDKIAQLLNKIPLIGKYFSRIYLWRFSTFNFMIVGASGFFLSWLLYEGFFRILFASVWMGTLIGMLITTLLVFLWNYFWNKHWSLGINSQILTMKYDELSELREKVNVLLKSKFNDKGDRIQ